MKKTSIPKQIIFVIGIIALAVSAGTAAAGLVMNSLIGSFAAPASSVSVQNRPSVYVNGTKVSESARSAVSIYKKRAGAAALDKVLLPSDITGAGISLTSDGWIATAASVLETPGQLVAVFSDKTAVALDSSKAVRDPATGIVFIKTGAQRLSVASFGDDSALNASDPVFVSTPLETIAATVVAPRSLPVATKSDYFESSERLGRRIIIDKEGKPGAPLVDASGLVIGLSFGDGTAVPSSFVTQVMRNVFRDGKISRPSVGVHFVSLDTLPNAQDAGLPASGALIAASGKAPAIAKGSAAEAARLADGDVIVAIEHDRISEEATFAERLQDYAPGAEIGLTVIRAGRQIKATLLLK